MVAIEGNVPNLEREINAACLKDLISTIDVSHIEWKACVTKLHKIICVGLNYRKHADETNALCPNLI